MLKVGEKVICNGYEGTVEKLHEGQLSGMSDVRLDSGVVCVDTSDLKLLNPKLPRGNRFSGHPFCYCSSLADSTCDFCRNTVLDPFVRLAIQWAEQAKRLEREKDDPLCPDLIAIYKNEKALTLRECSRELSEALKGQY